MTTYQVSRPLVPEKKSRHIFVPQAPGGSWWNFVTIGFVALEGMLETDEYLRVLSQR